MELFGLGFTFLFLPFHYDSLCVHRRGELHGLKLTRGKWIRSVSVVRTGAPKGEGENLVAMY